MVQATTEVSLEGRVFDGSWCDGFGSSQTFELTILKLLSDGQSFVGSCRDENGDAGIVGEVFPSGEVIHFLKQYAGAEARAKGLSAHLHYEGTIAVVGETITTHGAFRLPDGYNKKYNGTWEMRTRGK